MLAEPIFEVAKVLLITLNGFIIIKRTIYTFLSLKGHKDGAWSD